MTGLDARLTKRYDELVMGHSNGLSALATGMKALPRSDKAFAQTQALWRFLSNDRVRPVIWSNRCWRWPTRVVMDMRSGSETALARVIAVFCAAKPHCAYLWPWCLVYLGNVLELAASK